MKNAPAQLRAPKPLSSAHYIHSSESEEVFHQRDLLQLFPMGIALSVDPDRPILLLRDEAQMQTLAVPLNPVEAGVALAQSHNRLSQSSPHRFLLDLMESMELQIKQAVFVQIKGSQQYLRLYLSGHPRWASYKVRAEEAISLCLQLRVPLFCSPDFIKRSREIQMTSTQSLVEDMEIKVELQKAGLLN